MNPEEIVKYFNSQMKDLKDLADEHPASKDRIMIEYNEIKAQADCVAKLIRMNKYFDKEINRLRKELDDLRSIK